ncbi:hypothetical protein [Methylobacterium planeticum]|uniref:Energy transducer TonB n=1 Tax=Methylobacterium planeticum TaxID=2615211 RepID=A0A6N6MSN1_9HYPH|nr:hypothetical protein [Methylobacterium planeticum]KAB1074825.1 hypothetical protein F6X51_06810 [Methylobacterium planeticum]
MPEPKPKPKPEPEPKPPRLSLRESAFLALVTAWILAVILTDRAAPPTPPLVSYAAALPPR